MRCDECNSTDIITDEDTGTVVCSNCGLVLEDDIAVESGSRKIDYYNYEMENHIGRNIKERILGHTMPNIPHTKIANYSRHFVSSVCNISKSFVTVGSVELQISFFNTFTLSFATTHQLPPKFVEESLNIFKTAYTYIRTVECKKIRQLEPFRVACLFIASLNYPGHIFPIIDLAHTYGCRKAQINHDIQRISSIIDAPIQRNKSVLEILESWEGGIVSTQISRRALTLARSIEEWVPHLASNPRIAAGFLCIAAVGYKTDEAKRLISSLKMQRQCIFRVIGLILNSKRIPLEVKMKLFPHIKSVYRHITSILSRHNINHQNMRSKISNIASIVGFSWGADSLGNQSLWLYIATILTVKVFRINGHSLSPTPNRFLVTVKKLIRLNFVSNEYRNILNEYICQHNQ